MGPAPVLPTTHDPAFNKDLHVVGQRGLSDIKLFKQMARALFA